jgi:hypothetical protein
MPVLRFLFNAAVSTAAGTGGHDTHIHGKTLHGPQQIRHALASSPSAPALASSGAARCQALRRHPRQVAITASL